MPNANTAAAVIEIAIQIARLEKRAVCCRLGCRSRDGEAGDGAAAGAFGVLTPDLRRLRANDYPSVPGSRNCDHAVLHRDRRTHHRLARLQVKRWV